MKAIVSFLVALGCVAAAQPAVKPAPETARVDGVPVGALTQHSFTNSTVFPGTERDYWVYIPAQLDRAKPAPLMVFQDGRAYVNEKSGTRAHVVMDNLIHAGEIPPMLGVFVNPGVVPGANPEAVPRFNRSYEYDGLGDRYARFLIEEVLPTVEREHKVTISPDPNHRGIAGASSGAICAFTAAWNRPDAFRRVLSTIGTFVGLRGGDEYPVLVRKTEPKPLRVFLQDGSADLNIYCGDWWMANQTMLRALQWSGYEVEHVWGELGHGRQHEAAIFPDAMRWLWKDFPEPVRTHPDRAAKRRGEFLVEGEDWEVVSSGHGFTEGPAVNAAGEVFFSDIPNSRIHKIDAAGKVSVFAEDTGAANGLCFGPDGRLFACANGRKQIETYQPDGSRGVVAKGFNCNDLCLRQDGTIFVTDPRGRKVWRVAPGGEATVVDDDAVGANGVILNADQSQLYVTDFGGRSIQAYTVLPDGSLAHKQQYFYLHLPPRQAKGSLDGMTVDREGWIYACTGLGVQICDPVGRVHMILPPPVGARHPANACFGGPDRRTLYLTCGDKVLRRRMKNAGVVGWEAPVALKKPRL